MHVASDKSPMQPVTCNLQLATCSMLLIRHSEVTIDPLTPSTEWRLSENGRHLTTQLAQMHRHHKPDLILTSQEPKAVETGRVLAEVWQRPFQSFPNLHEHERDDNSFIVDKAEWLAQVRRFFEAPNERLFGQETAVVAAQRFETAVRQAQTQFSGQRLAFVSHGRILTAFLTQHNPQLDPITFWETLPLPSAIVVSPKTFSII